MVMINFRSAEAKEGTHIGEGETTHPRGGEGVICLNLGESKHLNEENKIK